MRVHTPATERIQSSSAVFQSAVFITLNHGHSSYLHQRHEQKETSMMIRYNTQFFNCGTWENFWWIKTLSWINKSIRQTIPFMLLLKSIITFYLFILEHCKSNFCIIQIVYSCGSVVEHCVSNAKGCGFKFQ